VLSPLLGNVYERLFGRKGTVAAMLSAKPKVFW